MAIPQSSLFQAFLNNLSLSPKENGYQRDLLIPESKAQDGERILVEKECYIWSKPLGDFNLLSLIQRIQKELESVGHNTDRNIVLSLIGLYCIHPNRHLATVQSLNEMLTRVVGGDLSQFFILKAAKPSNLEPFSFGTFHCGILNVDRLRSRSRKAGSDFFERSESLLFGRFAIERQVCRVQIFDWNWMSNTYRHSILANGEPASTWNRFVDAYFAFLSIKYFDEFWHQFVEQQELQVAAGAPFMGDRELRLMPASSVSVYLNIGQEWGHVQPQTPGSLTLNFGGMDRAIPKTIRELKETFGFSEFDSSELHHSIKTYARFLFLAKRHLNEQRVAEGFLHFVIALELLFGDSEGLSKHISRRVAVLTHRRLNSSFQEVVRIMAKAYDSRSKYLHEGDTAKLSNIDGVRLMCEEVLFCLLRFQRNEANHRQGIINEWKKHLDYFATAIESGRAISESELSTYGISVG